MFIMNYFYFIKLRRIFLFLGCDDYLGPLAASGRFAWDLLFGFNFCSAMFVIPLLVWNAAILIVKRRGEG